jgi:hypothetical protein
MLHVFLANQKKLGRQIDIFKTAVKCFDLKYFQSCIKVIGTVV